VRRELIARNPFDRVTFPKVGKPLIQTIDSDEFERLLLAGTAGARGYDDRQELYAHERRDDPVPEAQVQPR
jgi:hypothetical protein